MARTLTIIAALAMCCATSTAMAETPGENLASEVVVNPQIFSQGDDPYPDHKVAFPGGVVGLPDVTYQILPRFRPMVLDLYLPPASFKGPRPTVVFIHGGGWAAGGSRLSGAFDNWPRVLASISRHGYVVASVNYRYTGEAVFPGAIQDVKAAIRWLRSNSAKYRVDKERMATWGGSAGGQLAALAATSCGIAELAPVVAAEDRRNATVEHQTAGSASPQAESECVQAAVSWYGIFDFTKMPMRGNERFYIGCENIDCTEAMQRRASALTYLDAKTPPMLMIAGSVDRTVPPEQSTEFHAARQAKGVQSELMIIPDVDHSFIGKTPEATRNASRAALARTVDFFDRYIGDRRTR